MNGKAYLEDALPELTAQELEKAHQDMLPEQPWGRLYAGAPEMAARRIEIAYLVNHYAGKRNMWPWRDERKRVENRLSVADLEYLAENWIAQTGKEHYQVLLCKARTRKARTPARFEALVARLPEDERDVVRRTMEAVRAVADPVHVTEDLVWDALRGSADAQALLGDCFLHEHEVFRDAEIAALWLKKAAEWEETARAQIAELEANGLA